MLSEKKTACKYLPMDSNTPEVADATTTNLAPALSAYTDFRVYLKDVYEYRVKTQSSPIRTYSYAHFSAAANIKSPNYLKLIVDGKRNLSGEMIKKFSRALGHMKEEAEEFEALVHYGQAKDPLERNRCLKVLSEWRHKHRIQQSESTTFEKVPNWVSYALYALADQKNVKFAPLNLRDLLRGRASLAEIKRGIKALLESGELVEVKDGEIKKGSVVRTPDEVPAAVIRKLQSELIYLGLESLFQDKVDEREFGGLTLSLTRKEFEDLKFELRHLRKRIYKDNLINREKEKGDRVYQLNIQLYPISNES